MVLLIFFTPMKELDKIKDIQKVENVLWVNDFITMLVMFRGLRSIVSLPEFTDFA